MNKIKTKEELRAVRKQMFEEIDFQHNKVKCRKIEQLLPRLNQMVTEEMI